MRSAKRAPWWQSNSGSRAIRSKCCFADEDYLKWLTTQSNAFLADLQSRYPVFMAALSEALDKMTR